MKLERQTESFKAPVSSIVQKAQKIKIESAKDEEKAAVLVKEISEMTKNVETTRKSITDPIYKSYKNANEFFNRFLVPLKQANSIVRGKMSEHRTRQEEERRKKQEELDKIFAKEQEKLKKKSEKLGIEAPVIQAPSVQENRPTVGAVKYKKQWNFEIEDISKIPMEYLIVDLVKVRRYMYDQTNSGNDPKIDGVKFYQEDKVSL